MNTLLEAALEMDAFMSERHWDYCIIGGLAVQQWGDPRTTLDVDIALVTGWGEEAPFVAELLRHFQPRIENAHAFALEKRVVLIRASNGREVDIALGALPFDLAMIQRSEPCAFAPGLLLPCCTAEDLFIMKVFSGRPRDWVDATSVRIRQHTLDEAYILEQLAELCDLKEAPDIVARAKELLEAHP